MKTHVFSLLLSAAIFTTSPLFGMNESDNPPEKKGIVHKSVKFTDINEVESKGNFYIVSNDATIEILLEVLKSINIRPLPSSSKWLYLASRTSKGMYNLTHSSELLEKAAQITNFSFSRNSPLSVKTLYLQVQKSYLDADQLYYNNLFTDPTKEYAVKTSEMLDFMKGGFNRIQDDGTCCNFSING